MRERIVPAHEPFERPCSDWRERRMAPRAETTPEPFRYAIREGRVSAWVELQGELDAAAACEAEQAICDVTVDKLEAVLDLSRLTSIDDAGLCFLVRFNARAERNGCKLVMLKAAPEVRRLLWSTGVGGARSRATYPSAAAAARPAVRPENRQPPRKVPSSAR
jgi:anti-anti-sigma factor